MLLTSEYELFHIMRNGKINQESHPCLSDTPPLIRVRMLLDGDGRSFSSLYWEWSEYGTSCSVEWTLSLSFDVPTINFMNEISREKTTANRETHVLSPLRLPINTLEDICKRSIELQWVNIKMEATFDHCIIPSNGRENYDRCPFIFSRDAKVHLINQKVISLPVGFFSLSLFEVFRAEWSTLYTQIYPWREKKRRVHWSEWRSVKVDERM